MTITVEMWTHSERRRMDAETEVRALRDEVAWLKSRVEFWQGIAENHQAREQARDLVLRESLRDAITQAAKAHPLVGGQA